MPELSPLLVLVGTVVAFLIGGVYYAVFTPEPTGDGPTRTTPATLGVEVVRCLVTVTAIGVLVGLVGTEGWSGGLVLGLLLWIGFPAMLWLGAIVHEGTPVRTALVHAGDWLVKLVAVAVIFATWA